MKPDYFDNCCRRNSALCIAVGILLLLHGPSLAATQSLETVKNGLASNLDAFSPMKVAWSQQNSSAMRLDDFLAKVHDTNRAIFHVGEVTYVMSGPKCYHHDQYYSESEGKMQLQRQHTSYDGVKLRSGSDDLGRQNSYRIDTLDHMLKVGHPDAYVFYTEYLDAAGIYIGNRTRDLGSRPQSHVLRLLESGGEAEELTEDSVDGFDCVVVSIKAPTSRHRYWLSPKMGYAVVQHEEMNHQGQMLELTHNREFLELADPEFWLPKRSEVAHYSWYTAPDIVERDPLAVTEFKVTQLGRTGFDDSQFVIDTTKGGSRIADSTIEGEKDEDGYVQFNVPASAADLERLGFGARKSSRTAILVAVNVAVFLGFCGWCIYRLRGHKQS